MPTVILNVNVPGDRVSDSDVAKQLSSIAANRLNKPESYVVSMVNSGQCIFFGASSAPAAFVRLVSIGALNAETNANISQDISELLETSYGVPKNRVYIEFVRADGLLFRVGWAVLATTRCDSHLPRRLSARYTAAGGCQGPIHVWLERRNVLTCQRWMELFVVHARSSVQRRRVTAT